MGTAARLKSVAVAAAALTLFGFAPNPFEGIVRKIDPLARELIMEDGTTYALRPGFVVDEIRPGDRILVEWGMFHGKLAVDRIVRCAERTDCRR